VSAAPDALHVTHIITGLAVGGAETALYRLLAAQDKARFRSDVIALAGRGPMADKIAALGVPVQALDLQAHAPDPRTVARLVRLLRVNRPGLVQTWMYHADLLGGLAARTAGIPVVWGIRNSTLDPQTSKGSTRAVAQWCARLSGVVPVKIITNSQAARAVHVALGYRAERFEVIPNGFDLEQFKPDDAARLSVRAELGLPAGALLVGLVARFDPQKDHATFVQAAAGLAASRPEVHFLLCGDGIDAANETLRGWIAATAAGERFHLLGRREDMPRLTAALDVACLSSAYGEAFPNVVGEAMACGVPCAVTDVGDAAAMVAETGRVAPLRDPAALQRAMNDLLALDAAGRAALGADARRRVLQHYSLAAMVGRFGEVHWWAAGRG